jgi:hypothetical protein
MANNDNFTISFEGIEGYEGPLQGSTGGGLVPFQGLTFGRITKIVAGESKTSSNKTLRFEIAIEEPEGKGYRVSKIQAVTGMRKDKKPNALGLIDIFYSVYSGSAKAHEEALGKARAHEGTSIDVEGLTSELMDQTVWVSVKARKYLDEKTGREGWTTDLDNFVSRFRYEEAKAAGVHHRPNPAESAKPATESVGAAVVSNGAAVAAAKGSARTIL